MKLTFESLYLLVFVRFRRRRMDRFFALFSPSAETRVLDVGGTEQTWSEESPDGPCFPVTLLNILDYGPVQDRRFTSVMGDASQLPFDDCSFDIAFSNSVIEHVGTWQEQCAFAREVRRVTHNLWIQTPARSFPIEAHLLAPYIQYLPKSIQHCIARWTPHGFCSRVPSIGLSTKFGC